jgi:Domain of unknown function (DUF1905)/Bacteriocin-protection, YdeI or OmpD-Associated
MADKKLRFKVKLVAHDGSSATGLIPPFDVPQTFGTRARVPVRGTINGYPFRSSLMPMGGCYAMAVNKQMREGAHAEAGDEVDVVMERDEQVRIVEAPPELARELAKNKKAQQRWETLAFTPKKEMANSIRDAKQEETKKRRLVKVIQILKTGAKWTG